MITLDTSGLLALLDTRDEDHMAAVKALEQDDGPYLVPVGILAEVTYMVEVRLGSRVLDLLLADLESGAFQLDCGLTDLPRIRGLVERYADLPLGFADAAVVACAERNLGRVLTLDDDFSIVGREVPLTIFP